MRTLLRSLSLVALALAAAGCKSNKGGDPVAAELLDAPIYTKVGMHFDAQRGKYLMYSSNYISVPHYLPPGTRLTLKGVNSKGFELTGDDGSDYTINFVAKHSLMSMQEWREQHFSTESVKLPESLTEEERDAIANGDVRIGMSRMAVFLAIGYPPKSNNPSIDSNTLVYEYRRFMRRSIRFDNDDKVEKIGN